MWSKLSTALKPRVGSDDSSAPAEQPQPPRPSTTQATLAPDVMSSVREAHPNLSVFHSNTPSSASPPGSPTRAKRNLFKRMSKGPNNDNEENDAPFKLSLSIPKRIKANLNLDKNGSQVSLGRGSGDVLRDAQDINGRRPSYDSLRQMGSLPPTPLTPDTPFDKAAAAGSLRSILKDRNVPGTGRSVRFFSKDAFKIISPDPSVLGSSDAEAATIAAAMKSTVDPPRLRSPPRSVMDIFPESSPSMFNASTPGAAPTGDVSNFFGDVSFEHELPAISGAGSGLSINAFELADSETDEPRADEDEHTTRVRPRAASTEPFTAPVRTSSPPPGAKGHDRSQSFSFGQTLFHSVARTLSSASDPQPLDVNHPDHRPVFRPRAKSDTLFGMARTSSGGSDAGSANTSARSENVSRYLSALAPRIAGAASEDDIADTSSGSIAVFDKPEADPFAADAGTYYTPDAQTPPTVANKTSYFPGFLSFGEHGPPARTSTPSLVSSISGSVVGDGHSRTSSRDESLVIALRSQVAMQEQLARQFELDLAAKDELVNALQERLANTSAEAESRRGAARAWRKKVGELERACRALEERADRSAQDAMERSVLEEASGEALRLMHTRIGALESERHEAERSLAHVRAELAAREDQERALRAGILDAQAEIDSMADAPAADERARWQLARQSWSAEKAGLAEAMADAARAREALEAELDTLRDSVRELEATDARRRRELDVLQAELEAQWRHTEDGGERLQDAARARDDAESERDTLQRAVTALEARIEGMEVDFADGESRRAELEGQLNQALDAKDELERDREELEAQLQAEQARVDEVSGLLQQHEDRVSELDSELQYARETAGRLEDNMRARSAEVDAADERVRAAERAAEELHEQLSSAQREHTRALEQKDRVLADARADADSARADLAAALAKQAEGGVREQMDKDRIGLLEAELERLRRTVHQHQRESAAAEVKLVQLEKARAKDKEDLEGFNIALDSKQQEVEYMKRKMAERTSAPSRPTTTIRRPSGVPSSAASAVSSSRPPSAMSEASATSKVSDESAVTPPSASASTGPRHARMGSMPLSASTAKRAPGGVKPRGSLAAPVRAPNTSALSSSTSSTTPTVRKLFNAKAPPSAAPASARRVGVGASRVTSPVSASGSSTSERESSTPRARKIAELVPA